MGYFNPPKEDKHRCPVPFATGREPSTGWRCDECGKAYIRVSVAQHGESWYEWVRKPKYDTHPSPEDGYIKR